MTRWAGLRMRLPLAVQIILLLLVVLVLGQVATLAVVLALPPPRPPVYPVEDLAAALRGLRQPPHNGPPLTVSVASAPPETGTDARSLGLRRELARLLDAPETAVRARVSRPPLVSFPFAGPPPDRRRWEGRYRGFGRSDPAAQASPAPPNEAAPWRRYGRSSFGAGRGERAAVVVGQFDAAYEAAPGRWTVIKGPDEPVPNAWQIRMLLWFIGCLLVLTPAGYVFARRLTAPLGAFARAADRIGRDPHAPPFAIAGPAEIQAAARALNEMQERLARYVDDRTEMIAAIAHDLRTPLSRVEFKLQKIPPTAAKDIRNDLAQMEAMIAAVLAFVRDAKPRLQRGRLDLRSLLEVVVDDAAAAGADVAILPGPDAVVMADASALTRLFTNLVDNAVKYGGSAQVRLSLRGGEAHIFVEDPGPGIPPDQLEQVFEPFHRLETSRSRETGGIGLGLSVARSIARSHGGEVVLEPRDGGGLKARVDLPCDGKPSPHPAPMISHTEDINV